MTLIQIIFIALLCLGMGIVSGFFGYPLLRFLLPLWAFLAGMGTVFSLITGGFVGWILGIILGLIAATLAYLFLRTGLAIVGAAFGASLSATLTTAMNFDADIGFLINLSIAIIFAGLAVIFSRYFIVVATAFAGATGIITGGLLLLPGGLRPEEIQLGGPVDPLIEASPFVVLVWLFLSGAGIAYQYWTASTLDVIEEVEEETMS